MSTARDKYVALRAKLKAMYESNKDMGIADINSPEFDALLDEMDDAWWKMDNAERSMVERKN